MLTNFVNYSVNYSLNVLLNRCFFPVFIEPNYRVCTLVKKTPPPNAIMLKSKRFGFYLYDLAAAWHSFNFFFVSIPIFIAVFVPLKIRVQLF